MKSHFLFLFFFILVGCVQNSPHSYLQLGGTERQELIKQDCKDISAHGSILDHLEGISRSTEEVLTLLETKNPLLYQHRIEELASVIKTKAAMVHELSKPEWTDSKWVTRLGWFFFPDPRPGNWQIKDIKVETVYLLGERRDDLAAKVEFWERLGWINVNMERHASSLELCQLQKTLMVVFKVTLTSGKRERTYFYNLYINPTPKGEL